MIQSPRRADSSGAPRPVAVVTAVGPGSGLQVTPQDRSGGHDDGSDAHSSPTYLGVDNLDPLERAILRLVLSATERGGRAKLRVIGDREAQDVM